MHDTKFHAVIEFTTKQNDFCADVKNIFDSPKDILNHYGIYLPLTDKEIQYLSENLTHPFQAIPSHIS